MFQHMEKCTPQRIYDVMDNSKKYFFSTMMYFMLGMINEYLSNYSLTYRNIMIFTVALYSNDVTTILSYLVGHFAYVYCNIESAIYGLLMTLLIYYFAFYVTEFIDEFILYKSNFCAIVLVSCFNLSVFAHLPFTTEKFIYSCLSVVTYIYLLKTKNEVLNALLYEENYMTYMRDGSITNYAQKCVLYMLLNFIIMMRVLSL